MQVRSANRGLRRASQWRFVFVLGLFHNDIFHSSGNVPEELLHLVLPISKK